jgi:glycosyltransferase involved in cell wall biosynthesis
LSQSFGDLELVIADDGSSDGSLAIAREAAQTDDRVRVLALPHGGEVAARNAALAASRGELILNHDSDDVSLPGKLETLVAYLTEHPRIAIVGCLASYFDDAGLTLGGPALETSPGRIRATFGRANAMVNSVALIRRPVFQAIGGYREEYRSADDYDFFSRALQAGFELANVPAVLHRIRLHGGSVSARRTMRQADVVYSIQQDYLRSGAASGWRAGPGPAPGTPG